MTALDWSLAIAGPADLPMYADWLEEHGLPAMAHAARSLHFLCVTIEKHMSLDGVAITHVDFRASADHGAAYWLIGSMFWRPHPAAGLVAAGAWHGDTNPAWPAAAYVERTLRLRLVSTFGADPATSVRARFQVTDPKENA